MGHEFDGVLLSVKVRQFSSAVNMFFSQKIIPFWMPVNLCTVLLCIEKGLSL